ncbi:HTH-type transcriptional regulator MhqR [Nonomuraea coxensis DSM 45129]|uniref:HTH-type transcriptional regulator MhqR n=1 Tax=Nonomuraea coxensis DSM 45129 TaxID=1122611 RepID=A0ABX8TW21_9ACTN|nr:MarR family transcriptional regulator [Nonomuraea coxensis]QYC38533.1 HTH-type transcriptional regulator MhqR [Nonomuraea coxensis DSM 45129]
MDEPIDAVDEIIGQWARARPGVDVSPTGVIGRVTRAARLLDRAAKEFLSEHGLEAWEFDVLATLLRAEDARMCMKDLSAAAMVSPGALTNRIDHLLDRGLVDRWPAPGNRRMTFVGLTDEGRRVADDVLGRHAAHETRLLSGLPAGERDTLAALLRKLLLSLGDTPAPSCAAEDPSEGVTGRVTRGSATR